MSSLWLKHSDTSLVIRETCDSQCSGVVGRVVQVSTNKSMLEGRVEESVRATEMEREEASYCTSVASSR